MANEGQVLVEVLHGSHNPAGGGCEGCASAANCSSNIDYSIQTEKLSADLKGEYGDKVQVNYIDVDKTSLKDYPMVDQVLQMGYPYPITLINGEPKFAGGILLPEIKSVIDKLLEQ
jgi:disulfide oxidoreductase YuzD